MVCSFHVQLSRWDTPSYFQNKRFQGFISEILGVVSLLREKYIVSTPLRHSKFQESLNFPFYINVALPKQIPEQLKLLQVFEKL